MIIIDRNEENDEGLTENVRRLKLQSKLINHTVVRLKSLEYCQHDNETVIYIVAHGSPLQVGGLLPRELADHLGPYIRNVNDTKSYNKISDVYLHACNTGKPQCPEESYAELLSYEISEYLKDNEVIDIHGANGMTIYYTEGEVRVIEDNEPFNPNSESALILNGMDASSTEQGNNEIASLSADPQFHTFTAYPRHILERACVNVLNSDGITYVNGRAINTIHANNFFTEKFSTRESEMSEEESENQRLMQESPKNKFYS